MKPVSVSVIIPSYNCAPFVTQAIESVLTQSVAVRQIIVVDDGSKDDTAERLVPYRGSVSYVRQENQGVSAARNLGIRLAVGDYVAFLDADDVWHPQKMELQLQALEKWPDLTLVGTKSFNWPADQFPELNSASLPITEITWSQLVVRNRITTSSVVARREALLRAGPFDTAMQGPEDRDLWLRLAETGRVANVELALTGYRDAPNSVSKQVKRCQDGMVRILRKIDGRGGWRGRWLLRRRAYSYVSHSCAYLYGAAGRFPQALGCSVNSFLWYPLPYRTGDAAVVCERPRRLLVNLLRWLKLKPREFRPRAGSGAVVASTSSALMTNTRTLGVGDE
jgi:glycosyltransferase involved in cell wall biosynthesis